MGWAIGLLVSLFFALGSAITVIMDAAIVVYDLGTIAILLLCFVTSVPVAYFLFTRRDVFE